MKKLVSAVAVLFFSVGASCTGHGTPGPTPSPTASPTPKPPGFDCLAQPEYRGVVSVANAIAGRYIVVLKNKPDKGIQNLMQVEGVTQVKQIEEGYAAQLSMLALSKILANPDVLFIQEDGVKRVNPIKAKAVASWGLSRVDQRDIPVDGNYEPGAGNDGAGVNVAIVDTGVTNIADFGGRLQADCFSAYGSCEDGHGHGTHVSGTAVGNVYGIAKNAKLWASRVLDSDGSGSDSSVIRGIEWVVSKKAELGGDWVLSMSLGGGDSPALNRAVCGAIAAGITVTVAAGNESEDANNSSPARVRDAITVGAEDVQDIQADFSNFGVLLDLYAPGVDITSDQPDGGTATWSGTSMATPHVAGAAALYLQRHPNSTPLQVRDGLVAQATVGHMKRLTPGSPDRILYVKEN